MDNSYRKPWYSFALAALIGVNTVASIHMALNGNAWCFAYYAWIVVAFIAIVENEGWLDDAESVE